jgi:hypothetical protein
MGLFDGQGLLGLGGLSLGGSTPAMGGLLGSYYDPAEAKRQQMKQFLLGAGAGMLSQGNSPTPISFGQSLGAGLQGGLLGAQKAQEDYQKNALLGYQLAQQQQQQAWQTEQQGHQKAEWAQQDAQRKAQTDFINTIQDPNKRAFAQADPNGYMDAYKLQVFPSPQDQNSYYGTAMPVQLPDGTLSYAQPSKTGTWAVNGQPMPQGSRFISPEELNTMKSRGTETGKMTVENQAAAPGQIDDIAMARGLIQQIKSSPYLSRGTGFSSLGNSIPGTGGYDFQNLVTQAKSGAFLTAIQKMRGLGALSDREGGAAMAAITRMDTATSEEAFKRALDDYEAVLNIAEQRVRQRSGGQPVGQPAPQQAPAGKTSSGVPWSVE